MTMQRCTNCKTTLTEVAVVCVNCLSREFENFEAPTGGRLVSWTTIRRAPAGYCAAAPYDVVVVDLAPTIRVTGRLAPDSLPPSMGASVHQVGEENGCRLFVVSK
jgi:uncharacterized OB-fold protein